MRLVPIDKIKIGEALGYAIRSQDGKILLRHNSVLTEQYVESLRKFKINGVYVEDDMYSEVEISPAISDDTKMAAMNAVTQVFNAAARKQSFNESIIKNAAASIIGDLSKRIRSPINLYNLYAIDDAKVLHSVNTAVITAAIGYSCEIPLSKIQDYTIAALLHDTTIEGYDKKDFTHAESTVEYLKSLRVFSNITYASIAMHHEHFNGTGGPKKISGDRIYEGARVIAVADYYDRLVYGLGCKQQKPHLAVEYLNMQSGTLLDPDLLIKFGKCMAIYPTGATVILNNGYRAVVMRQNDGMPTRPIVKLLMPEKENCIEFNMLTNTTLFIEDVEI